MVAIYFLNNNSVSREVNWTEFEKVAREGGIKKLVIFTKKDYAEAFLTDSAAIATYGDKFNPKNGTATITTNSTIMPILLREPVAEVAASRVSKSNIVFPPKLNSTNVLYIEFVRFASKMQKLTVYTHLFRKIISACQEFPHTAAYIR